MNQVHEFETGFRSVRSEAGKLRFTHPSHGMEDGIVEQSRASREMEMMEE